MAPNLERTQRAYARMRRNLRRSINTRGRAEFALTLAFAKLEEHQTRPRTFTAGTELRTTIIRQVIDIICDTPSEAKAVRKIAELISLHYDLSNIWLAERAKYLAQLVHDASDHHMPREGARLLDYGCGDAAVAGELSVVMNVQIEDLHLYDVYDGRGLAARMLGRPFTTDRNTVDTWGDADRPFDLSLLITVLHHCDDPDEVIDFVLERSGHVFVIESVLSELVPWTLQMLIDWFYNRCLHAGEPVPVPGHFRTRDQWVNEFTARGFEVVSETDYRIDLLVAAEHHMGWLLRRK